MPYNFTPTQAQGFKPGMLYLGVDRAKNYDVGMRSERHAICFAGARSGKGSSLLIPTLIRWPHNALVIDPKGENAEATWEDREGMGQTVAVLDPFRVANVPDRLRVSCNLLAAIDPNGATAREDIRCIADGLVMRFKTEDATWDNGAVSVLSGFIDYVLNDPQSEGERDLPAMRRLLAMPPADLEACFADMAQLQTATGLARAAAAIGLSDSKKNREFVGGAVDHSEWLDSPAMASVLTGGGVDLSALKSGRMTLFLVLPPQYLGEHGRFLRLFVRCALDAMAKGLKGEKCLFLLDEFYSLGHLEPISKSAGLMPGYGVILWPFLQDLGQLVKLYGKEGAETFFGNSDAHIFFGNTDALTLNHISARLGVMTIEETGAVVPQAPMPSFDYWNGQPDAHGNAKQNALYDRERSEYSHAMAHAGRPRLTPEEVRELVAKKDGDTVARSMIVFGKGKDVFNLSLSPYFKIRDAPPQKEDIGRERNWGTMVYSRDELLLSYVFGNTIRNLGLYVIFPFLVYLAVLNATNSNSLANYAGLYLAAFFIAYRTCAGIRGLRTIHPDDIRDHRNSYAVADWISYGPLGTVLIVSFIVCVVLVTFTKALLWPATVTELKATLAFALAMTFWLYAARDLMKPRSLVT